MLIFPPCGERIDDIAQTRERKVNLFGLLERLSPYLSFSHFLTPSQINQAQFGRVALELQEDCQNSMAPRALFVGFSRRNLPTFRGFVNQVDKLYLGANVNLFQSFDVDAPIFCFFHFQIFYRPVKHVNQVLFVDLDHRTLYFPQGFLL